MRSTVLINIFVCTNDYLIACDRSSQLQTQCPGMLQNGAPINYDIALPPTYQMP